MQTYVNNHRQGREGGRERGRNGGLEEEKGRAWRRRGPEPLAAFLRSAPEGRRSLPL